MTSPFCLRRTQEKAGSVCLVPVALRGRSALGWLTPRHPTDRHVVPGVDSASPLLVHFPAFHRTRLGMSVVPPSRPTSVLGRPVLAFARRLKARAFRASTISRVVRRSRDRRFV